MQNTQIINNHNSLEFNQVSNQVANVNTNHSYLNELANHAPYENNSINLSLDKVFSSPEEHKLVLHFKNGGLNLAIK